jgi:cardiolipin synthase (CMP-forming)
MQRSGIQVSRGQACPRALASTAQAGLRRHQVNAVRLQDIPNVISALRLVAVIPVVWLLLSHQFGWALTLFALSGISDGVDGFLAKRFGWQSRLGGILDPLADKTLLVSCFLVLGSMGAIPVWLVLAVVSRDLVIVAGALLYNYRVEELEAAPTRISKLNTLVQLLLVIGAIMSEGPLPLPEWLIEILIWGCLSTVLVSGVQYVWVWSAKARAHGWHE